MRTLWQDVRFGARTLLKNKSVTLVAVAALALGIGANTAIFSVVNGVLLRPLSFPDSGRVTAVLTKDPESGSLYSAYSFPNFEDVRDQNKVFERVAAFYMTNEFLRAGEEPERMRGAYVSADLFPLLGVGPEAGRTFSPEEERNGGGRFIVLSHEFWQRRFGGDAKIVGRELTVGSQPVTVVGVMPRGFKFPLNADRVDFWMPLVSSIPEPSRAARGAVYLGVVARLKAGVTLEQAQSDVDGIASRLAEQYPAADTGFNVALVPAQERLVGKIKPALLVLLGAVACVLLIACANVANLLLARATVRRKEIAIRTAIGASRRRVVRQLLTESLLLSALGGATGLLLAMWGLDVLVAASPADLPRAAEIGLDKYVLAFAVCVTTLTGLVFGLAPALQASKTDLGEALKDGSRGGGDAAGRNRLRGLLVVSEVALSLVLLVGAGLLFQSFRRLLDVAPGFEPENVLAADITVSDTKYPENTARSAFYREALERIKALPGVEAAGVVDPLPLGGSFESYTFDIAGRPPFPPGDQPSSARRAASPDYFRAMGIPLLRGRAFGEQDKPNAQPVVIINETFARRFFPGQDAVGQSIIPGEGRQGKTREIVGVVGDVRHAGLDAEVTPEYYVPYEQASVERMTVVARTASGNPSDIAGPLRGVIRSMDREQPVYNVRTMTQLLDDSLARRRFNTTLLACFSALALLLASIGIYGVMSYTVAQRTREIGIRIALGARAGDVIRLVLRQGLGLALAGVGAGLLASYFLTKFMSSMLYGVSATDPLVFGAGVLMLLLIVLLACLVPARRATKVDPMVALRYE
jgi:putative ABC transport system permease protein